MLKNFNLIKILPMGNELLFSYCNDTDIFHKLSGSLKEIITKDSFVDEHIKYFSINNKNFKRYDLYGLVYNNMLVAKTIVYYKGEEAIPGERVYLMGLGVKPSERHKGYGTKFLKELSKEFYPLKISLGVEPENEKAMGLYKKCGFVTLEENKFDVFSNIKYNLMIN